LLVHVLTPGFTTPNGCAFLFPLEFHRKALAERGVTLRTFRTVTGALGDCDVLIVDSKFHRLRWERESEAVVAEFAELKRRCSRLLYFDTTDSTGGIQVEILPLVDRYCKSQLLRDRKLYLQPMYGARIYADYYHRNFGVADSDPEYSVPVPDAALLGKLTLSWNSGLADHSLFGPARMALYRRVPLAPLLRFPAAIASPSRPRANPVSCRFGANYPRQSVAWQRRRTRILLGHRFRTAKVSRAAYFRELASSKLVVSPFGYGEITLKDFEVFLTGGILITPDMGHLETWPDLFRAGETMLTHRWDLTDLEAKIDEALGDYPRFRAVAEAGQAAYLQHLGGAAAQLRFIDRFLALVSPEPDSMAAR
jgi:hypothetical protein